MRPLAGHDFATACLQVDVAVEFPGALVTGMVAVEVTVVEAAKIDVCSF